MSTSLPPCSSCGARGLTLVSRSRHPLDLAFCQACTLVQTTAAVPVTPVAEVAGVSSSSESMRRDPVGLADRLRSELQLGRESLVVELGSRDCRLLQAYLHFGIPVLGIEPAANVVRVAAEGGIQTLTESFTRRLAERLRAEGQTADVVHAHDALARSADLNDFVSGIHALLVRRGVTIVETAYLPTLIDALRLDSIDHEQRYCFSLTSLMPLFSRHGLRIDEVHPAAIDGGFLLLEVGRSDNPVDARSAGVDRLLAQEAAWGVADSRTYLEAGRAA